MHDSLHTERNPQGEPAAISAQNGESASELVASMAHDVRHLGEQYLELMKLEIRAGVDRIERLLIKRLIGGAALGLGALFLILALAFGAIDELGWSRWAAFGALGLIAVAGGAALQLGGKREPHT
jgi:hypothetical protein